MTEVCGLANGKKRVFAALLAAVFLAVLMWMGRRYPLYTAGQDVKIGRERYCVVVDAGHGGEDPGKIGCNGEKEKDINLQIAKLVAKYLEAEDVRVVMTRTEDEVLAQEGRHKKVQDMKRRVEIIEQTAPGAAVSIHQNSYPEEYVHGAQVFYYTGSASGEKLAEQIQKQLIEKADPENRRKIKANDSYYLLKKTSVPIVIVECGFLSNQTEAAKLCDAEYQERIAWAVAVGILQYLNKAD